MEDAKAPRGKIIEKNKQFFFLTSEGFLPLSFYFCGTSIMADPAAIGSRITRTGQSAVNMTTKSA